MQMITVRVLRKPLRKEVVMVQELVEPEVPEELVVPEEPVVLEELVEPVETMTIMTKVLELPLDLMIFGDLVHITQITLIKPRLLPLKQLIMSQLNKELQKLCQTKTLPQLKPNMLNKPNNKRTVSEDQEEK